MNEGNENIPQEPSPDELGQVPNQSQEVGQVVEQENTPAAIIEAHNQWAEKTAQTPERTKWGQIADRLQGLLVPTGALVAAGNVISASADKGPNPLAIIGVAAVVVAGAAIDVGLIGRRRKRDPSSPPVDYEKQARQARHDDMRQRSMENYKKQRGQL